MAKRNNRRSTPRESYQRRVTTICRAGRGEGVIGNVSERGLYIETSDIFPEGTRVQVHLGEGSTPAVATARVTHVQYRDDAAIGLGLRIIPWSEVVGLDSDVAKRAQVAREVTAMWDWGSGMW